MLAASTGLAIAGFLGGLALFVGSLDYVEHEPAASTDGIVALTGGSQRIEDAVDLLAKGYGGRLLISGVNERTTRDELKRLSPNQADLIECCVDLGYMARNTVGNATEIGRWARARGYRSLIVVTSNYHLPRTLAELDRVLPGIRKVPYAVVSTVRPEGISAAFGRARLLTSEYVKFMAAWLRARVVGEPADPFETDMPSSTASLRPKGHKLR